ncbi:MAG: hypothetical protein LBC81_00055 [Tannerellaceae bacterium]|jgi:hypothetical protein|nr:hypothetical protein [Tannerellaceae bacterium]
MTNVDEIIKKSLERFISIKHETQNEHSDEKLIFPCTRNEDKRLSEQEIKQLFIDELIKGDNDYYYSVEAPTTLLYTFSGQKEQGLPPVIGRGQSARIDVCLYAFENGYKRKHLIEFKAKTFDAQTDFLKLKYENEDEDEMLNNYFVHVLNSYDSGTIKRLEECYEEAFALKASNGKQKENKITVFVCMADIKLKYSGSKNIISFCENNYKEALSQFLSGQ